jgi:Ser/Thr protein kinase RdoA (MazF antagonist)
MDLYSIARNFKLPDEVTRIAPHGEGHINKTYLVETKRKDSSYILQHINADVFNDIPALMDNMSLVLSHLQKKQAGRGLTAIKPPQLIPSRQGNTYFEDAGTGAWRCTSFIPGAITYQNITAPSLAQQAGMIIGLFQSSLTDLQKPLHVTIQSFHDLRYRLHQFDNALERAQPGRKARSTREQVFVESRREVMVSYQDSLTGSRIPMRITHNDTKVNNILFNSDQQAICLIDLDTVMPGYIHYDYGDALRTLASTAEEDEADLDKIAFDMDLFEAFSDGYLRQVSGVLLQEEMDLLPFAPLFMTFMIGTRFLTDYLDGDRYYATGKPRHNLIRAKAQFKLLEEMEGRIGEMEKVLRELLKIDK